MSCCTIPESIKGFLEVKVDFSQYENQLLGNSEVIHRIDSLGIYVLEKGKVANLAKYHKDVRCFKDETFTPQTRLPYQKELNKIVELSFFKNYLD